MPAKIQATGQKDVTAQLEQFLQSVPNHATVVFPRRARYRIDGTIELRDRTDVTLDGNHAILFARRHGGPVRAQLRLLDGSGWTIRDLTIRGANPSGGSFDARYQWQHGIDLRGVAGALIASVTVTNVFGDDIYVGLSTTNPHRWSRNVSIINSTGADSGRMAIAITAGRHITVRGGRWSNPGLNTFDIEPNGPAWGADGVIIEGASIGVGTHATALGIAGRGPVSHVLMRNNRFVGRALTVLVDQGALRPRDVVVRDNISTVSFRGPGPAAMSFRNVDGLTVSHNRQPLQPRGGLIMVSTEGCSKVIVTGERPYLNVSSHIADRWVAAIAGLLLLALLVGRRSLRTMSRRLGD